MASLESHLTPALLSDLRDFWFEHIGTGDAIYLPSQEHVIQWFRSDEQFDNRCVERYGPVLHAIKDAGVSSGQDILDAAKSQGPLDYLSIILLLDQMPRNCFRGDSAGVAFKQFDPLSQYVAKKALELGIPDSDPQIRWTICRRMWFYIPFMHSEDLELHKIATGGYDRLERDFGLMLDGSDSENAESPERQKAAGVLKANEEWARQMPKVQADAERRHRVIIEQFGRYPHRNKAMGREATKEEEEYLASGGETFSAGTA